MRMVLSRALGPHPVMAPSFEGLMSLPTIARTAALWHISWVCVANLVLNLTRQDSPSGPTGRFRANLCLFQLQGAGTLPETWG